MCPAKNIESKNIKVSHQNGLLFGKKNNFVYSLRNMIDFFNNSARPSPSKANFFVSLLDSSQTKHSRPIKVFTV
ncbi:hypothetical protein BpHYR1_035862 [Brachionus plicatilis]|uniref:Uncharacterized protein n=1 Tax=Brachionus plicatilis TaxID=10195 RepID=A0A3M7S5Q7_BRAPC|nr:hypothetical protein BpHYR1_035862 [Brachionus plicatilis]